MGKISFTLFLIIVFTAARYSQAQTVVNSANKFEIVYQADVQYAYSPTWLKKMKNDWKATAINLRIYRCMVERFDGSLDWNNKSYRVDSTLKSIANAGLNIYLRISYSSLTLQDVNQKYTDDDFHIRSNGERFLNVYEISKPLLNITSQKSRGDMVGFLSKLVNHLNKLSSVVRSKIKLIVPALSPDDETEFPFTTYDNSTKSFIYNVLTGYSSPEIAAFMKFLEKKYVSINALNESWGNGARFTHFDSDQIRIRTYNWDGIRIEPKVPEYYKYEIGRTDFLDFRREELKKFIDDCSLIVKKARFKFGVQFGSMYDGLIEFRGFYDPTPLIEKVDQFITDDILEYYPNFSFSADYARSLSNYWTWKNKTKKRISFGTESNWPGYAEHKPEDLIKYWSLQVRTFYEKGASCLFISQWGTVGGPNDISEKVLANSIAHDYRAWKDTLLKFQNVPIKIVTNDCVYQLACEQGLHYRKNSDHNKSIIPSYIHNNGFIVGNISGKNIMEFPLNRFSKLTGENEKNNFYDSKGDFVTNYMLQQSPDYVKRNYKKFYLTGTSVFMPKSTTVEQ